MRILACIFSVVYYYDFFRCKCKSIFYLGWNFCSCNCSCGFDTGKTEEKVGRREAFRQMGRKLVPECFLWLKMEKFRGTLQKKWGRSQREMEGLLKGQESIRL